ncbi:hypothetical protein Ancab_032612 [Ancistrocladus abbreviatus]
MRQMLEHLGRRLGAERLTIMVSETVPFSVIGAAISWGQDPVLVKEKKLAARGLDEADSGLVVNLDLAPISATHTGLETGRLGRKQQADQQEVFGVKKLQNSLRVPIQACDSKTPGREFLLRVSYQEIYNEMIESSAHSDEYDGVIFSQLGEMTMSNEMDLLVERVKMLAGDIAFSTITLKRLLEQFVNDPDALKTQIQNLEHEIQEKKMQMRILEQHIIQSVEASVSNASLVDMQQVTVMRLMTQCNEKSFELEVRIGFFLSGVEKLVTVAHFIYR